MVQAEDSGQHKPRCLTIRLCLSYDTESDKKRLVIDISHSQRRHFHNHAVPVLRKAVGGGSPHARTSPYLIADIPPWLSKVKLRRPGSKHFNRIRRKSLFDAPGFKLHIRCVSGRVFAMVLLLSRKCVKKASR